MKPQRTLSVSVYIHPDNTDVKKLEEWIYSDEAPSSFSISDKKGGGKELAVGGDIDIARHPDALLSRLKSLGEAGSYFCDQDILVLCVYYTTAMVSLLLNGAVIEQLVSLPINVEFVAYPCSEE